MGMVQELAGLRLEMKGLVEQIRMLQLHTASHRQGFLPELQLQLATLRGKEARLIRKLSLQATGRCPTNHLDECASMPTWAHRRLQYTIAPRFQVFWATHHQLFQDAARGCVLSGRRSEEKQQEFYDDHEQLLNCLAEVMCNIANDGAMGLTITPKVVVTAPLAGEPFWETEMGVDIVLAWKHVNPREPYPYTPTVCRFQPNEDVSWDPLVAQLQDCATSVKSCMPERDLVKNQGLIFSGVVINGLKLKSVVIWSDASTADDSYTICSSALPLATAQAATGMYTVDVDSQAFSQLVFHVWLSLALSLHYKQVAAVNHPPAVSCFVGDNYTIMRTNVDDKLPNSDVSDQQAIQFVVSGGQYGIITGHVVGHGTGDQQPRLGLLRLGLSPADQALALKLELPWAPWFEVEREQVVRQSLQHNVRYLAPTLALGTLTDQQAVNPQAPSYVDRSVLLVAATGIALVPPHTGQLPVLQIPEVVCLLYCLLSAVLDLNAQGTWHNAICPSNVFVIPTCIWHPNLARAPPRSQYYLHNLSAAASPAVTSLACKLQPGRASDWDCCSHTSPNRDLLYASWEALLGLTLSKSSDIQSAIFTAIALSGNPLPWAAAAAVQDRDAVRLSRMQVQQDPTSLPGVSQWPQELQRVVHAAIRCQGDVLQLAQAAITSLETTVLHGQFASLKLH